MIYINDVASFRDPESYKVIPDDRIEKIELIGGVAYQDYGHIRAGDSLALTCLFSQENWDRFVTLWETRAKVSFTDTAGVVHTSFIITVKEFAPDENFPNYIMATFELWRK